MNHHIPYTDLANQIFTHPTMADEPKRLVLRFKMKRAVEAHFFNIEEKFFKTFLR